MQHWRSIRTFYEAVTHNYTVIKGQPHGVALCSTGILYAIACNRYWRHPVDFFYFQDDSAFGFQRYANHSTGDSGTELGAGLLPLNCNWH